MYTKISNRIITKYLIRILVSGSIIYSILAIQAYYGGFLVNFNLSKSFDNKIIITNSLFKSYKRGHYIVFTHPLFDYPICKQIVGIEGDEINITGDKIYVAGIYRGEILKKGPYSDKPLRGMTKGIIPKDYLYVFAPHPHSFDSCYNEIGLLHKSRIEARAWLF